MRVVPPEPMSKASAQTDDPDEIMPPPLESNPQDPPQFGSAKEGATYFLQKILAARDETKP
jgi:hypothetical protein